MARRRNRSRTAETSVLAPLFAVIAKVVLGVLVAIVLTEIAAGLIVGRQEREETAAHPVPPSPEDVVRLYDSDDYRRYQDALAEGWAAARLVYRPFVETAMAPHAGHHFTVTPEGWRAGPRPAALGAGGPAIFVFGGSTTLGLGVPDGETLPSRLEESLRDLGREARVFNFGTLGHFSTPERILLESLVVAGRKPHLAIFVDGLEDFVHCAMPERGAWSERLAEGGKPQTRPGLAEELAERSRVVALLRLLAGGAETVRAPVGSPCRDDAAVDRAARRLDANRRMIAALGERLGFKVLFVQQPVPTHHYDNERRPVALPAGALEPYQAAGRGVRRLTELRQAGELFDHNLLWLADTLPESNPYVDAVHYSPAFNRLLGQEVARHVVESGLLP